MLLPNGQALKTGIDVAHTDFPGLLEELKNKGFAGYACITVRGENGLEEGALFFDGGKVVGAAYEYQRFSKNVQGKLAWERVVNATGATHGVIDVIQTRSEDVRSVLAREDKTVFMPSDHELRRAQAQGFSPKFEEDVKTVLQQKEQKDLLKKYKLAAAASDLLHE